MNQIEPSDIIAFIVVAGCLILIGGFHEDGTIRSVLLTVTGYYFGTKSQVRKKV